MSGPQAGGMCEIVGTGPFTIGRQEGQNLVLRSDMVSRLHAVIEFRSGKPVLVDKESANGTYVNGVLIREHELRDGDRISFGGLIVRFESTEERGTGSVPTVPERGLRARVVSGEKTLLWPGSAGHPATSPVGTIILPATNPGTLIESNRAIVQGPSSSAPHQGTAWNPTDILNTIVDSAKPVAERFRVKLRVTSSDCLSPPVIDVNIVYQTLVALLEGTLKCVEPGTEVVMCARQPAGAPFCIISARTCTNAPSATFLQAACEQAGIYANSAALVQLGGEIRFGPDKEDTGQLFAVVLPISQ